MKCEFLVRNGSPRLLAVFAGWSTDRRLFSALDFPSGYDVMLFSGYSGLDFDRSVLDTYSTISIVAWSLGVWAAENSFPSEKITFAIAINGTPMPCDDIYGIPQRVFNTTRERLDDRNLRKFRRRMVADKDSFESLLPLLPENDDIDRLKDELLFIADKSAASPGDPAFPWTRAYISDSDAIFPPDAQAQAWSTRSNVETVTIHATHYFDFQPLFKSLFPDKAIIGKKFHSAFPTYHEEATAQKEIACHLASLIADVHPEKGGKMLEIGPATGFLTSFAADLLKPSEADFVDLFPLRPFGISPTERFHCADAESWLPSRNEKWDYIVSASAVQWFAGLEAFFKEASLHLNPDGILAISTFAPGNLPEIARTNPFGLLYHSTERLEKMLHKYFRNFSITTGLIPLSFPTAREALLHLRHTGVSGGMATRRNVSEIIQSLQPDSSRPATLTYLPVYIIASLR